MPHTSCIHFSFTVLFVYVLYTILIHQKAAVPELFTVVVRVSVSAEVARQESRIVAHHPGGPRIKRGLYVFIFIAHKQMHLQLQI